ncbi:hypothetical protein [Paenibacillus radicis (ex Gao et al. 2016)]|uniref:Uncharacterized protein n=1 Tax=Paenibacillus radicis (ex Gao et al. 2016) TaxID=1737354 RepID=A0A917H023_9BACL|nr:hypothetical protein [Paenibacillus radicis (ex Gao et al. 2016)]GGG62478.1 hypothetical protein GCM10010918_15260 [Paenibacillus radicis (ex Gao et al. 2016)]
MKLWQVLYMIACAGVGFGCFMAVFFISFNLEDGFMTQDNKPLAALVAVTSLLGLTVFFFIGKAIFNSNQFLGPAIVIIIISAIFSLPVMELITDLL